MSASLAVVFFLASTFLVWRSFYGMRIQTARSETWRVQVDAAAAAADS